MNLLQRFAAAGRGILTGRFTRSGSPENPSVDINDPEQWDAFMGGESASSAGVKVGHKSAFRYGPWFRGVALISVTVGKLPIDVFKSVGEERERFKAHDAYRLLKRKANAEMTAYIFKQVVQANALTKGNGYAYIFRDTVNERAGRARELIPMSSTSTFPVRVDGELWYVTSVNGQQRKLHPSNVIHIKGFGTDGLVGFDLVSYAKNALGLGIAAEKFGSNFFKNAAKPSCWIEIPKSVTPDAARKLADSWDRLHGNLDKSHRTAVFEDGAKVHPFSFNAQESQLSELRKFQLVDVANFLGIPVHKLGGEGRTGYASLEQENQADLDDCIDPWLVNWEQECHDKLLTEDEKANDSAFIEFNRSALVRANMVDRYNAIRVALGGRAFMSRNEGRKLENLGPVTGGDVILDPLNMAELGDLEPGSKKKEKKSRPPRRESAADPQLDPPGGDRRVTLGDDVARRLLLDVLGRMARRLGTQGRRAAKEPAKFTDWLEAARLAEDHRTTIVAAVGPAVDVMNAAQGRTASGRAEVLADRLLGDFRADLVAVTDTVSRDGLAAAVESRLQAFETTWPETVAGLILKGEV